MSSIHKKDLFEEVINRLTEYRRQGRVIANFEIEHGMTKSVDLDGWFEYASDGTIIMKINLEKHEE